MGRGLSECLDRRAGRRLDAVVIGLIGVYQRYLSPHKGYRCAHRRRAGRASCSEFARRAIARRGLVEVLILARRRFQHCAASAAILAASTEARDDPRSGPCPILTSYDIAVLECCGEAACAGCSWL